MIRIKSIVANMNEYAVTPVTVHELKLYLQLEGTAYDAQLQAYLWAATEQVEQYTNTSLTSKAIACTFEQRSAAGVRLPFSPLDEIVNAQWKYCPVNYDPASYTILNEGEEDATFVGTNLQGRFPYPTYRVVYITKPSLSAAMREAVKVQAGWMYTNRDENAGEWSPVAKALAQAERNGNF